MKSFNRKTDTAIKNFIALRNGLGWSQAELAKRAGLSSTCINYIERGKRKPALLTLLKLSRAFKISLEELTFECSDSNLDLQKVILTRSMKCVDPKVVTTLEEVVFPSNKLFSLSIDGLSKKEKLLILNLIDFIKSNK